MDVPEFAVPERQETNDEKRGAIASHPYVLTLLGTAFLILIGIVFVLGHGSTPASENNLQAWGGANGVATNPGYATTQTAPSTPSASVQTQDQASSSEPDINLRMLGTDQSASDVAASDLDALLAQISGSAKTSVTTSAGTDTLAAEAYSLIPTGLVATTSMSQAKLTKSQSALYQYGNDAGSIIQTYEYTHQNVPQILKDQASDRTDPDKAASVNAIGKALVGVGTALLKLSDVPSSIGSYNTALGKSYQDIGSKLSLVSKAGTDDQFLTAVQNYDAAADVFTKNYIAIATYLSASGVTFSPDDSGSVFSFKPVSY